ncbi:HAD family hydrolase [Natronospira bacteriovora]|uniref:HAD-IA family hydrolase n=1 Tax=Natronospira bacteriovora TaxID=3069753 RepID=A0ABU0W575_9GAMM|nr:HAD-IA family hydrolase [Natronospira sp. AB-CW4]MDQ2069172.1 HAD-IA family hydrolase [Natronospira sp. AB-CW4]
MRYRALLLDLDGTLADTAADLGAALNALLLEEGRAALPPERIRPVASDGARGLLSLGFAVSHEDARFAGLRERLLDAYMARIAAETRLFDGMQTLLARVAEAGMHWGIVTNKPTWLTEPLMSALAVEPPAACVVCGDTAEHAKPHPAPLLHAARAIGCAPQECLYVGDAARDIEAAIAAGMPALVAGWGYLPEDDDPGRWGAQAILASPEALRQWLSPHLAMSRTDTVSGHG